MIAGFVYLYFTIYSTLFAPRLEYLNLLKGEVLTCYTLPSTFNLHFTARAMLAVYAVIVCPPVCLSVCHKSEFYKDG